MDNNDTQSTAREWVDRAKFRPEEASILVLDSSSDEAQSGVDTPPPPPPTNPSAALVRISAGSVMAAAAAPNDVSELVVLLDDIPISSVIPEYFSWHPAGYWLEVEASKNAFTKLKQHAASDIDHEVFGLLVGTVRQQDDGMVVTVEEIVAARGAQGNQTTFVMSGDAWTPVLDEFDRLRSRRRDGRLRIVGWYHTHPNMDIFLSQADVQVHTAICRESWQIAVVHDSRRDWTGIFTHSSPGGDLLTQIPRHELFRMGDVIGQGTPIDMSSVASSHSGEMLVVSPSNLPAVIGRPPDAEIVVTDEDVAETPPPPGTTQPPILASDERTISPPNPPNLSHRRETAQTIAFLGSTVLFLVRLPAMGQAYREITERLGVDTYPLILIVVTLLFLALASIFGILAGGAYYFAPMPAFYWRLYGFKRITNSRARAELMVPQRSGNYTQNVTPAITTPQAGGRIATLRVKLTNFRSLVRTNWWWLALGVLLALLFCWYLGINPLQKLENLSQTHLLPTPNPGPKQVPMLPKGVPDVDAWVDPDTGETTVVWSDKLPPGQEITVYRRVVGSKDNIPWESQGKLPRDSQKFVKQASLEDSREEFEYAIVPESQTIVHEHKLTVRRRRLPQIYHLDCLQVGTAVAIYWDLSNLTSGLKNGKFFIYRDSTVVAELGPSARAYLDRNVEQQYSDVTYKVVWRDGRGLTKESGKYEQRLSRSSPQQVQAQREGSSVIRISWGQPGAPDCSGYRIYRGLQTNGVLQKLRQLTKVGPDKLSFADENPPVVEDSQHLCYQVVAEYQTRGSHREILSPSQVQPAGR